MWLVWVLRILGWGVIATWVVQMGYGALRGGPGFLSSAPEAALALLPALAYAFVPIGLAEILFKLRQLVAQNRAR